MAKFNPNKLKAFQDFLELQNELKAAQTSYENAKNMEVVTDTIMGMGIKTGAAAQKHYMRSRNRKLLLVGMVLAGGAYLYKKTKKDTSSSRRNGCIDYSRRPKKPTNHKYEEVQSNAK